MQRSWGERMPGMFMESKEASVNGTLSEGCVIEIREVMGWGGEQSSLYKIL